MLRFGWLLLLLASLLVGVYAGHTHRALAQLQRPLPLQQQLQDSPRQQACARAADAVATLQKLYYNHVLSTWGCGLASAPPSTVGDEVQADKIAWWNCGETWHVLSSFVQQCADHPSVPAITAVIKQTYLAAGLDIAWVCEFNDSMDDMAWWALGYLSANKALNTGGGYISRAQCLFKRDASFWDDHVCGGGVWWSSHKTYKNAITNELFGMMAVQLYEVTQDPQYLQLANKEWTWFRDSGMMRIQSAWNGAQVLLVNDGLTSSGTACTNNGQTTWTYNSGVLIGMLARLYVANGRNDQSLLDTAWNLFQGARVGLAYQDGVLREPCEPNCNADQQQFKGILVRYLAEFAEVLTPADSRFPVLYSAVANQTESLWNRARSPVDGTIATVWEGPTYQSSPTTVVSHTSGIDALVALAHMERIKEKFAVA